MGSLLGFLGGLGNILLSTLSGSIGAALDLLKQAFNATVQYHKAGIEFARGVGMSLKQAQAYTDVLTQRAENLAYKYGLSAEAVKELQVNLAQATGKAMMLNDIDAERFARINKLVGSNVANNFISEITTHLGGSINAVTGAVSKAYATAAKNGLNAAQFSEKVARNLYMANKLSFRDGVNGIIRMTALSEKLGFNLQSVERAAENFMELDKAIEHSAQLQMLGGAAGAYGSNPLMMSYEANYDPEAFTERMTKTLGGYATFDAKTGMANVNGMNKDFVKAIGDAMGIGMEEAMSIAKKQAEIAYKEANFGNEIRSRGYSKEQENYIINSSYVGADGKLKMTDMSGREQDVDTLVKNGQLDQMMAFEGKTEEEIMRDQALTLTTINEQIDGLQTSSIAAMAKSLNREIPHLMGLIDKFAPTIIEQAGILGEKMAKAVHEAIDIASKLVEPALLILKQISKVIGFIYDYWKWFAGAFLLLKGANFLGNVSGLFRRGANAVSRGANAVKNASNGGLFGAYKRHVKSNYQFHRQNGKGRLSSARRALLGAKTERGPGGTRNIINRSKPTLGRIMGRVGVNSAKSIEAGKVLKFTRLAKGVGLLGVGLAGVNAYMGIKGYNDTKNSLDEQLASGQISQDEYNTSLKDASNTRNEGIGSAAGSVIFGALGSFLGPLGTAAGSWLGGVAGAWVGKRFNSIADGVTKTVGAIGSKVKGIFGEVADFITGKEKEEKSLYEQRLELEKSRAEAQARLAKASTDKTLGVFKKFDELLLKTSDEALKGIDERIRQQREGLEKTRTEAKAKIDSGKGNFMTKMVFNLSNQALEKMDKGDKEILERNKNNEAYPKFDKGGIVSGNSTQGDNILVRTNDGEMVLNKTQQSKLFDFINSFNKPMANNVSVNNGGETKAVSLSSIITSMFANLSKLFMSEGKKLWDTLTSIFSSNNETATNTVNNNIQNTSLLSNSVSSKFKKINNILDYSNIENQTSSVTSSYQNKNVFGKAIGTIDNAAIGGVGNTLSNIFRKGIGTVGNMALGGIGGLLGDIFRQNKYNNVENTNFGLKPLTQNITIGARPNNSEVSNISNNGWQITNNNSSIQTQSRNQNIANTIGARPNNSEISNTSNNWWQVANSNSNIQSQSRTQNSIGTNNFNTNVNANALNSLGSYATFDAKTGVSSINGMNRDLAKTIGESIGLSVKDALSIAKKQAETSYLANSKTPITSNLGSISVTSIGLDGIKSVLKNKNDVKAKPVGEKEYIYEPRNTNTTNVGGNKVTVNDINVKINGTIKLDGGNSVKNIDVSQLLSDNQFISSLKEIIKSSINNDINGGRFMNDTAQMRGLPSQTALWGRKG